MKSYLCLLAERGLHLVLVGLVLRFMFCNHMFYNQRSIPRVQIESFQMCGLKVLSNTKKEEILQSYYAWIYICEIRGGSGERQCLHIKCSMFGKRMNECMSGPGSVWAHRMCEHLNVFF